MAWQMKDRLGGAACPILDAGRGQVYAAIYRAGDGWVEPLEEVFLSTPEELPRRVRACGEPVTIFGQMDRVDCEALRRGIGDGGRVVRDEVVLPDALAVAQLARRRFAESGGDDIAALRPIYVRMSYAEERFDIDLGLR
jgi:tRNA A37 threonylcarbamoyladenosine modification protein TsaB